MSEKQQSILDFWFEESESSQWFQGGTGFDDAITARFLSTYEQAMTGEFDAWQESAEGALALIILLDQMPRNMFRGTPKAFASDDKALKISRHALAKGFDQDLPVQKRRFIYLPLEHSENLDNQHDCVALFEAIKDQDPQGYEYALKHLEVIEKFGRFPHRNEILGRENTALEKEYLAQPDAGF